MKNPKLMKKAVPAAASTEPITFRLPVAMIQQIKEMAAEQGISPNAVAQKVMEAGMLQESLVELVRNMGRKVDDINYNNDKVAQVLGDIATGVDSLVKR